MVSRSRLVKALLILVLSLTVCTLLLVRLEPALNSSEAASPRPLMAEQAPSGDIQVDRSRWCYIVIHHSATEGGNAARFAQDHRERLDADSVGYHFVIGNGDGSEDGCIEICPRWKLQQAGAHARVDGHPEYNERGIGICLVGNFQNDRPTERQMKSLVLLVRSLQKLCGIADKDVVMHGDLKATECPGRFLRQAWAERPGNDR
jgi:N-acetyl-anhydromuramyl-L-alanine amidase AmpD